MVGWFGIVLLYALGLALIVAEVYIPAYGAIGIVGLCVLAFAVYQTSYHSENAAIVAGVLALVLLPIGIVVSVKMWHRTPVGRLISPPNRKLTKADRMPVDHVARHVGTVGRTLTPLRPVGTCEFDGKRVECVAEFGMIERGVRVEAVRVIDRTLSVQPVREEPAE